MDARLLIAIISYILVVASLIYIPLKRRSVISLAGNCLLSFPNNKRAMMIGVDIVAFILITIVFLINYSMLVTFVLCGCGVLGAWIITGEAALGVKAGLYDNGIIAIGKFISYDDIVTFPVLNLPKNEQKNHPSNVLVIASRKFGNVEIAFDSDSICLEVISKLKELDIIK